MPIDPAALAIALAGVFLISFMRGAFGGGFAVIGIPLLSLAPVAVNHKQVVAWTNGLERQPPGAKSGEKRPARHHIGM
jgi:uncharacterized membrane protein YfcA